MGFTGLALAYGLSLWLLGPWFDRRGVEWAFYEAAGRRIPADMALTLLYDDWDRNPYESPFGRIPHDLAVPPVLSATVSVLAYGAGLAF